MGGDVFEFFGKVYHFRLTYCNPMFPNFRSYSLTSHCGLLLTKSLSLSRHSLRQDHSRCLDMRTMQRIQVYLQ